MLLSIIKSVEYSLKVFKILLSESSADMNTKSSSRIRRSAEQELKIKIGERIENIEKMQADMIKNKLKDDTQKLTDSDADAKGIRKEVESSRRDLTEMQRNQNVLWGLFMDYCCCCCKKKMTTKIESTPTSSKDDDKKLSDEQIDKMLYKRFNPNEEWEQAMQLKLNRIKKMAEDQEIIMRDQKEILHQIEKEAVFGKQQVAQTRRQMDQIIAKNRE